MEINKILNKDVLQGLSEIDNDSIDCIITSPPYYQLRDYGFSEQWGLEKTYQEYLDKMISFMAECKRVIKDSGSIWINLGDSYSSSNYGSGGNGDSTYLTNRALADSRKVNNTIPDKCLMLIPHRFAIRCVDELGLILRNDIIWAKPNGMPESVTDRFSKKHEFFFFFVKSKKYYFDLDGVRGKHNQSTIDRCKYPTNILAMNDNGNRPTDKKNMVELNPNGKNPGDVADFWSITTKGSSEKHYATFNSELIDKPIVAGSPEFVCVKCGVPREKIIKLDNLKTEGHGKLKTIDKFYGVHHREGEIMVRDLPDEQDIIDYLRKWKKDITYKTISDATGLKVNSVTHWFTDINSSHGFSYPSKNEWIKLKTILNFDDFYDKQMTTEYFKDAGVMDNKYKITGLTDCNCNAGFTGGIVLDPFAGTGTTLIRALELGRNVIGIEGKKEYSDLATKRINKGLLKIKMF